MKEIKFIIINEEERNKLLKLYFTEEGVVSLENRLRNMVKLFLDQTVYPFTVNMYGFPPLIVKSKESFEGMIENLKEILYIQQIDIQVKRDGE